jgi:hypothetical protein
MSSKMHWFVLAAAVPILVASGSGQARGGDITYQLVNYPAYQDGWTLSGSITTNGTLGLLTNTDDFLSWTWTVSQSGQPSFTVNSTEPGAYLESNGPIMASSTQLILFLPPPVGNAVGAFGIGVDLDNSAVLQTLTYLIYSNPSRDLYSAVNLTPSGPDIFYWSDNESQALTPQGTFIIAAAAVPEPASVVLGGLAAICGIAYGLARKSRAHRQATTQT